MLPKPLKMGTTRHCIAKRRNIKIALSLETINPITSPDVPLQDDDRSRAIINSVQPGLWNNQFAGGCQLIDTSVGVKSAAGLMQVPHQVHWYTGGAMQYEI